MYALGILLLVAVLFTRPVNNACSWFDLHFFKIQPSEFVKRTWEAARACVNTVIDHMKPGEVAAAVAARGKEQLSSLPPDIVWHGCYAYSIGLGFPPKWDDCPVAVEEGADTILQPGMVFHTSCSLRDVGRFGVTFGDTVLITDHGCEVLTGVPRELVVK